MPIFPSTESKRLLLLFTRIRKYPISAFALLLSALLLVGQADRTGSWRNNRSIIHDITSYYSYLPAVFIYKDLRFNYRYQLPDDEPLDHLWVNVRGDTVFQKMSVGLSYFYLPTFLAAHAYTLHFTDHHPNGFSRPYQLALSINTLVFGLLGLWMLFLLLSSLYSDLVSALSILSIYAGTNLLYYISGAPGLSHPYSFFLVTVLLWLTFRFYASGKTRYLLTLAFTAGLLGLVRPTNLLWALYPVLYGLNSPQREQLRSLLRHPIKVLAVTAAFLLPWLPQLFYWKFATGQWLFYSYDQEGFFFLKPHLWDGLLSYRKGWLIYTPIMLLSLVGLFLPDQRERKWPVLLILPFFLYVVFSWWCWWYGGSFGSRVMVETYPFMALGLASMFRWMLTRSWTIRLGSAVLVGFMLLLNLHQTWQFNLGMLHWDSMTKDSYWSIFLKDVPPDNFQQLIDPPDYKAAMERGE